MPGSIIGGDFHFNIFPQISLWIGKITTANYVMKSIKATIAVSASLSQTAANVFIHSLINLVLITAVVIMNGRLKITSLSKIEGSTWLI